MPKIFHVNWFRTNKEGKFLWPGYGDNIRVIDWMCNRLKGDNNFVESPIGHLPKAGLLILMLTLWHLMVVFVSTPMHAANQLI